MCEDDEPFDVEMELEVCRQRRLIYEAAVEREARVEKLDPSKNAGRRTRVALDSSAASIPSDVRRVASYTTLYVLETGLGSRSHIRWVRIRQAVSWMTCFWESRRSGQSMTDLVRGEAELAAPYGNMLKVSAVPQVVWVQGL